MTAQSEKMETRRHYTIKLFSPWHKTDLVFDDVAFSPNIELHRADAVLAEYELRLELFTCWKPKAWYSWETLWHGQYRTPLAMRAKREFKGSEWLYFANPDLRYRVPHITNCGKWTVCDRQDRNSRAVAIVSNHGGKFWFLRRGMRLRNRFVTHALVDLFGREQRWKSFTPWGPLGGPRIPRNYRGEARGTWMEDDHIDFLASFKVAICLENSQEPFYFSEKFLNAAKAGCIPVYAAHQTVRDGILRGARWVDPSLFDYDPVATIEFAQRQDIREYQEANARWLAGGAVQATHFDQVWRRLAAIFRSKIECQ